MKSIHIVVPVLSLTFPENAICIIREQELLIKEGYKVEVVYHMHESLISRGRCVIAKKFMQSSHDYLMCIDSDIIFSPGDVLKLIRHDKDIIGANYRHKTELYERYAGRGENNYEEVVQAHHLATGFQLIKKGVFEKLIKYKEDNKDFNLDWFKTTDMGEVWGFYVPYITKENHYLSEDWAFTERLKEAGIKSYMENRILLGHIGKKVY